MLEPGMARPGWNLRNHLFGPLISHLQKQIERGVQTYPGEPRIGSQASSSLHSFTKCVLRVRPFASLEISNEQCVKLPDLKEAHSLMGERDASRLRG